MYCQDNQSSWDENLPHLLMANRSSKHSSAGFTPNRMMLGREILPVQAIMPMPEAGNLVSVIEYVKSLHKSRVETHTLARKNMVKSNSYQKRQYVQAAKKREVKPGQAVWLFDPCRKKVFVQNYFQNGKARS